jgi:hypothetical protein
MVVNSIDTCLMLFVHLPRPTLRDIRCVLVLNTVLMLHDLSFCSYYNRKNMTSESNES